MIGPMTSGPVKISSSIPYIWWLFSGGEGLVTGFPWCHIARISARHCPFFALPHWCCLPTAGFWGWSHLLLSAPLLGFLRWFGWGSFAKCVLRDCWGYDRHYPVAPKWMHIDWTFRDSWATCQLFLGNLLVTYIAVLGFLFILGLEIKWKCSFAWGW